MRFPLVEGEFVAMEFHVGVPIPEWKGKKWSARYEEIGVVSSEGFEALIPMQTELLLIHSREWRTRGKSPSSGRRRRPENADLWSASPARGGRNGQCRTPLLGLLR